VIVLRSKDDSAYVLVEVLVGVILLAVVLSLLAGINLSVIKIWEQTSQQSSLGQEALISMEVIIQAINRAVAIETIKEEKLTILTADGQQEQIYYKPGVGLCRAADNNIISNRVIKLKFIKRSNSLLVVKVVVQDKTGTKKLKTGIEI
jgi:type II secretory pathway component PulJ